MNFADLSKRLEEGAAKLQEGASKLGDALDEGLDKLDSGVENTWNEVQSNLAAATREEKRTTPLAWSLFSRRSIGVWRSRKAFKQL